MSRVAFTPITVRQAEEEKDSRLFILNRTRPVANISLNVTSSNGEKIIITMPISPCPVDLTNFCQKEDLLKSPVFRRLVAGAHISIINTEEAATFVANDPRGIRETKRIFQVNTEGDQYVDGVVQKIETTFIGREASTLAEQVGAGSSNMFIENLVLRSKSEDASDLISELDARLDSLVLADIEYLSNHAHSPQIKEWAVEARSIFDEA